MKLEALKYLHGVYFSGNPGSVMLRTSQASFTLSSESNSLESTIYLTLNTRSDASFATNAAWSYPI